MSDPHPDASRVDALEIHAAHQAQVIDDLHATVAAQWTAIDTLRRQLEGMAERVAEAEARAGGLSPGQKPPHY